AGGGGGSNIPAGVVRLNQGKAADLSEAAVVQSELWRHGDEDVKRDDAVDRLVEMLESLVKDARKSGIKIAPVVGIGCPGIIDKDGSIERGAQNLPGNWESNRFNLPRYIQEKIPKIGDHKTMGVMQKRRALRGLTQSPICKTASIGAC